MLFDQNKENFQPDTFSGEPQEEAMPLSETVSTGPDEGEKEPLETFPAKPLEPTEPQLGAFPERLFEPAERQLDSFSESPFEPAEPQSDFFPESPFEPAESPSDLAPVSPAEQAKPLSEDASSTDSLMEVILPAENSEIKPDIPAVNQTHKKIIAVGGAKGGVGKSMLAANLAVGLALLGQKVVLADLDLGGADVHLYTGVKSLAKTWNDFLDKKVNSIGEILTPTAFEGLSLIGGDSSKLGSANLPYVQKLKIMRHLKELETDYLIVDLGGDTTFNGLDFFLLADQKIVVSGTEPASVLDSYSFVKVVFNRFLERFFSEHKLLKDLAEQIKDGSFEASESYSLDFIYQEVFARDPQASVKLQEKMDQFRLSIVLNMTESSKDVRIAESMQKLAKDKCFVDIGILGIIPFDKAVRKAARGFTPIVVESPKCQASRNIHKMLAAIILDREQESTRAELLDATSRIRREAKEQIDSSSMTLDGLTVGQINSAFNNMPRLRQSFQKILNILTG